MWDSTIEKKVLGTNVVLLIWTDGRRRIPLGLRIWQKGGKSKLKLAEEVLREARRRGVTPMYVLFDAWYSGESLLNLLEKFGWQYLTRVKKNRLFNRVMIDQTFRHHYSRKSGTLKKINHEILIVKDGERFLLTNNLELTSAQVKRIYPIRQRNRKSLSPTQTGVRLGKMSGKFGAGTKGTSSSRIVCVLLDAK